MTAKDDFIIDTAGLETVAVVEAVCQTLDVIATDVASIETDTAMAAARSKDTYLGARYRRLSGRIGKTKAIVATEHTMLIAIWNMAQTGALYDDLGADYYSRLRPDRTKKRAIDQLQAMGYTVTLDRAG